MHDLMKPCAKCHGTDIHSDFSGVPNTYTMGGKHWLVCVDCGHTSVKTNSLTSAIAAWNDEKR